MSPRHQHAQMHEGCASTSVSHRDVGHGRTVAADRLDVSGLSCVAHVFTLHGTLELWQAPATAVEKP
jgi:hypothetical protein